MRGDFTELQIRGKVKDHEIDVARRNRRNKPTHPEGGGSTRKLRAPRPKPSLLVQPGELLTEVIPLERRQL